MKKLDVPPLELNFKASLTQKSNPNVWAPTEKTETKQKTFILSKHIIVSTDKLHLLIRADTDVPHFDKCLLSSRTPWCGSPLYVRLLLSLQMTF